MRWGFNLQRLNHSSPFKASWMTKRPSWKEKIRLSLSCESQGGQHRKRKAHWLCRLAKRPTLLSGSFRPKSIAISSKRFSSPCFSKVTAYSKMIAPRKTLMNVAIFDPFENGTKNNRPFNHHTNQQKEILATQTKNNPPFKKDTKYPLTKRKILGVFFACQWLRSRFYWRFF